MPSPWSLIKRIAFRFAFAYLVLYNFPFPFNVMSWFDEASSRYDALWQRIVTPVGKAVFGADTSVLPNGSGDTTYNYVQVFCFLVIALFATAVWSILDRKRTNYARLHEGLRIYIRFALAGAMISYGAVNAKRM